MLDGNSLLQIMSENEVCEHAFNKFFMPQKKCQLCYRTTDRLIYLLLPQMTPIERENK